MGEDVNAKPRPLHPWEGVNAHCIGGWVGPRDGLDGCGKSHHCQDLIPELPSPYQVPIPTMLLQSTATLNKIHQKKSDNEALGCIFLYS